MRPLITKNALVGSTLGIITTDSCQDEDPKQIVDDMLKDLVEKNYELILDRKSAVRRGIDLLKNNDVLLILGRGHQEVMYIKDQVIPYSDRKVALEYLEEIRNKVTP
jgi:UDP-N-acetylmuramoyl-L-alanyl-D-glutamate--2,6-diaminopimelate ligase